MELYGSRLNSYLGLGIMNTWSRLKGVVGGVGVGEASIATIAELAWRLCPVCLYKPSIKSTVESTDVYRQDINVYSSIATSQLHTNWFISFSDLNYFPIIITHNTRTWSNPFRNCILFGMLHYFCEEVRRFYRNNGTVIRELQYLFLVMNYSCII